jgi:hypothetical protein
MEMGNHFNYGMDIIYKFVDNGMPHDNILVGWYPTASVINGQGVRYESIWASCYLFDIICTSCLSVGGGL